MKVVEKILLVILTVILWLVANLRGFNSKKDTPFQRFKYGQRLPVEPINQLLSTLKTVLL